MCEYHALAGNALLEDAGEVLLRQVHPSQLQEDGVPTKQAFLPTDSHARLLSTKRESVTPVAAYTDWVGRGFESAGTWGISIDEIAGAQLHAVDDATNTGEPFHASVNFQELPSKGELTRRARILRDHAADRGCLHRPTAA